MTTDPSAPPQVSVVIPALNAASTLGVQLAALAAQETDRSFEVLVADNGSTDGTADVVREWQGKLPDLRLVDASARTGSNAARNAGAQAARSELVLLCDADDAVHPQWLEALAGGLERAPIVGGRLDRLTLNQDFIEAWGAEPPGQLGIIRHLQFLPRPIGANAGFRRSVWVELGGFDEDYVRGGAETEFYWRAQLRGHELLDVPEAVVAYRMRPTHKTLARQMYIWGRQAPMLYRDFRPHGMRWDPKASLRAWRMTVGLARRARRSRIDKLYLSRHLAYRAGRVVGSVKYRVLYF